LQALKGKRLKIVRNLDSSTLVTGSFHADNPVKNTKCNTNMRNIFSSILRVPATELQNLDNLKQIILTIQALILLATFPTRVAQVQLAGARALTTYQLETRISKFIQIFCILNVYMTLSIRMRIAIKT
jgi:hypothetical protein